MPISRLRGGTPFISRLPKKTSPASGVSNPAIIRRVVVMTRLSRVPLQPLPDEALLVGRVAGTNEVEIDELHVGDLRPAHRHVGARDAAAAPCRVRRHRGPRYGPVQEAPRILRILGTLDERVALEGPGHAVGGMDDLDGCT